MAEPEQANKGGRPTKYKPEYDDQVRKLCLLGATDEQIADFFEVAVSTVYLWAEEHEGFSEARKKGKTMADADVAEALYHRAIGYSHPEEKIMSYEGEVIRADTTKHYPPDTAAAFIWLKNRAGWRDKVESEVRFPEGVEVRTVRLPATEEDAEEWAKRHGRAASGGDTPGDP